VVQEGHKRGGLCGRWCQCKGLQEVPGEWEGLGAKGEVSPAPWLLELGASGKVLEHSHENHI